MQATAYIALGSNLGDRQQHLTQALQQIAAVPEIELRRVSSLLENPAIGGVGGDDAPPFLNAAAELRTTLPAPALLEQLLDIERSLGRTRRAKWEPRVIDLDLLLYGDAILANDDCMVPHPLMHERRFVLQPLAEIAPDVIHPTLQMTIAGLLDNLSTPPA